MVFMEASKTEMVALRDELAGLLLSHTRSMQLLMETAGALSSPRVRGELADMVQITRQQLRVVNNVLSSLSFSVTGEECAAPYQTELQIGEREGLLSSLLQTKRDEVCRYSKACELADLAHLDTEAGELQLGLALAYEAERSLATVIADGDGEVDESLLEPRSPGYAARGIFSTGRKQNRH